jgi:hypothetical protein
LVHILSERSLSHYPQGPSMSPNGVLGETVVSRKSCLPSSPHLASDDADSMIEPLIVVLTNCCAHKKIEEGSHEETSYELRVISFPFRAIPDD